MSSDFFLVACRRGDRRNLRALVRPLSAAPSVSSVQNLPELAVSTKKTDPHRDGGNSETRGHFLCGKLHQVAEETYVPQFRTQLGDGICQDAKLLETGERGF